MLSAESTVAIHTLRNSKPAKLEQVVDHGRFLRDLADKKLSVVITNLNTFKAGELLRPVVDSDGTVRFTPETVAVESLAGLVSMHNRVLGPLTHEAATGIPRVNSNELKEYANSKSRLNSEILGEYQVPTLLIPTDPAEIGTAIEMLGSIEGSRVIVKKDNGSGGGSTQRLDKAEAAQWLEQFFADEQRSAHVMQPEIIFGTLPETIRGVSEQEEDLVRRSRQEGLLTELRLFVVKRQNEADIIPIGRIVADKDDRMGGASDTYVDVTVDDSLMNELAPVAQGIIDKTVERSKSAPFAVGAVDFYFLPDGGFGVMEANIKSPQLPRTRDNAVAGRAVHRALAKTLATMGGR
ncbi:hypothetical protein CYG49_04900 [Candidatus Saccharibacteria bacterium]|nr:MAG: hypothetical protein CYG49_04900 [Candidatus Saccharibacteria bacterium]